MLDVLTYVLARNYTNAVINSGAGNSGKEIEIEEVSGQLPEAQLQELIKSPNTIIKLDGKYYRLARLEGDNYKYISSFTNGSGQIINMVELDINKTTGEFSTKPIIFEGSSVAYLEEMLQDHINDNNVHITNTERNY